VLVTAAVRVTVAPKGADGRLELTAVAVAAFATVWDMLPVLEAKLVPSL
jgi:hypothetical protein